LKREALIGKATPFDFVDAKDHAVMRAAFEAVLQTGRAASYEVHVPLLDAWYASVVGPILEHGEVTGLSILTRETTEQKLAERALQRSEQRLREAQKMEAIGTLAGGIAHDINNMLTPILAYADLTRLELAPDHRAQRHLQGIRLASERARELVQRILLYSRRQEAHKAVFDLRQSVDEEVMLLRATLPANVELVTVLPDTPVNLLADRGQIGQVLTNLATNALQAMPTGGKLTIALEHGAAGQVLLSVADCGAGMDAETARRVFDPFFTTKSQGEGSGLGLDICRKIVSKHHGTITFDTSPSGTTFFVRIPFFPPPIEAGDSHG